MSHRDIQEAAMSGRNVNTGRNRRHTMTVRPTGPRPFFPFGILRLSNQQCCQNQLLKKYNSGEFPWGTMGSGSGTVTPGVVIAPRGWVPSQAWKFPHASGKAKKKKKKKKKKVQLWWCSFPVYLEASWWGSSLDPRVTAWRRAAQEIHLSPMGQWCEQEINLYQDKPLSCLLNS